MEKIGKRVEKLSLLEKINAAIPGFIRYARRGKRREADRLLRDGISSMLKEQERNLGSLCEILAKENKMDLLGLIDTTQKKIARAADKIKYATYGASGLFDLVQVGKKELDRLYNFDAGFIEKVEEVKAAVEETKKLEDRPDKEIANQLKELNKLVGNLNNLIDSRKEILLEG